MPLTCTRCGGPMPELNGDLTRLASTVTGFTVSHDICPGETPPVPEGRYFEVRVRVVEVPIVEDGQPFDVIEYFRFERGVRAPDLEEAMRPLALALGERWEEAEKAAKIADADHGASS